MGSYFGVELQITWGGSYFSGSVLITGGLFWAFGASFFDKFFLLGKGFGLGYALKQSLITNFFGPSLLFSVTVVDLTTSAYLEV